MAELSERLRLLRGGRRGSGEPVRVLIATIEYALPDEQDALALAAIRTGNVGAIAAVVRRLNLYGPEVIESLGRSAALEEALEQITHENHALATDNAVFAIEATNRADLLHLLLRLLDSPLDGLADRASRAILSIIVKHIGECGRRFVPPQIAKQLDYAVADALETYPQHRNRRCLLAAAIAAARPGPRLAKMIEDPHAPPALSLRSATRDLDDPLVRRNLINWLSVPALAGPVLRSVHHLRTAERFTDFLSRGHLLRDPARRRAIRRAHRPKQCVPPPAVAANMDRASQRWLPDLIASLGLPVESRIEHLRDAVALDSPLARLRAAHDLAALATTDEAAMDALRLYCFDRDPAVARSASRHLLDTPHRPDEEFLARLIDTGRAEIAQPALEIAVKRSAAAFFEHWLNLSDQQRLAAAHRLIMNDRNRFVGGLRDRIALSPREERLAAIDIARKLRIVDSVAEAIIIQTASADPRIASAAVAALPQTQHPRRIEAARTALRHVHPRVRANAIETLASIDEATPVEIIAPLMAARENRVRANAIRAVIERKPDRAEPNLRAMLRDANPLHRVSAVWVAKRCRASAVLDELAAIAVTDPLEPVRQRAAAANRAILLTHKLPNLP